MFSKIRRESPITIEERVIQQQNDIQKTEKPRVGTSAHKGAIWRLPGARYSHRELYSNVFKIKIKKQENMAKKFIAIK